MSWWNTSNFTDLASKALKNAQKKIDKALDIQDSEGKGSGVKNVEASSSKTESGDFWNSWLGDANADGSQQSKSPRNAWSLPWGAGNEQLSGSSGKTVKEKTAEEIKSEVLKAAKERTKAKSKLLPQKGTKDVKIEDKEIGVPKENEVAKQEEVLKQEEKPKQEEEPNQEEGPKRVEFTHQSGVQEMLDNLSTPVELVKDENATLETVSSENKDNEKDDDTCKSFKEDYSDQTVDLLKVRVKHSITDEIDTDIKHLDKSESDIESCHKELSDHENDSETFANQGMSFESAVINYANLSQGEYEDATVFSQIESKPEDSLVMEASEPASDTNILNTSFKVVDDIPSSDRNPDSHYSQDFMAYSSGADISSSVEFVTDKDLECAEIVSTPTTESGDTVNSDPEIIDVCDKIDSGNVEETGIVESSLTVSNPREVEELIQSESYTDIGKVPVEDIILSDGSQDVYEETSQLNNVVSESLSPDKLEAFENGEKGYNLVSSDSESSMSKLDTSVDTCTSEETLVELNVTQDNANKESNNVISADIHERLNVEIGEIHHEGQKIGEGSSNDLLKISETHKYDDVKVTEESAENPEDEDKGELSPANSFVKCMLEDAIDDSKQDDNSDSHSATEKSDGSRSVYSNHESSDEIDTTTSSDIEIISMPTPNGENRQISPVDPIPLRIALQKTSWPSPTHRRTDSSDSSNTSKDGGYAELSPGRDTYEYTEGGTKAHHDPSEGHRQGPELPALREEDDPLHPQKLLKEGAEESNDMSSHDPMSHDQQTNPDQKLAEVSEILQVREDKLVQLSKENCDLMETNNILRNQLKQAEETREAEMTDINELTTEFTQRLTDSEKRIASVLKEKEVLRKQLQDAQTELANRAGDIGLKEILAEKEDQIAGLLEEGEKLSKSQLQSNNIIKKLRQKEKDNESTLSTQKKKLDTQKEELDHLHKVLESKEEVEKKQTEAITQLSSAVKKQEQELTKVKGDYEEAVEKMRGLQAALDNSYKEMAELHRNNAAQDSKVQEIALSAEMQVREELKLQIEKQQQQNKWEKETLGMQIEDLQMTMTRMEKDHSRREDLLRQEIADLQKQLQEDEARTQELTQGVSLATRPLLRQIENLQATFNAQSATWEKVEKNLSDRLAETQNQLAVITEKERNANEQMLEISTKVSSLEAQNSRLRQEKSHLTAQLEMLKSKVEMSEDAKQHEAAQLELMRQQMQQEINDIRKEKVLLETQLDVEKSKMEQEKKKSWMLQEQIRDLERDLQRSRSRGTPVRTTPSPISVSRQDSLVGSLHEQSFQSITQEELDRSFILSSPNGNKQSLYEALRQSGAANLLENLQSQLKLRDGEINHLQGEIRSLERTRESMAKELVDLSNKNDDLEDKVKDLPVLQGQHQELDQRYNALLQMYGEKVEEANELRMDLADVKDMYKAQITQLLGQS